MVEFFPVLVHFFFNLIEMLLYSLFLKLNFKCDTKISSMIKFTLITGVINTFLEYGCKYFGQFEMPIRAILMLGSMVIILTVFYKVKQSLALISSVLYTFINATGNILSTMPLVFLGLKGLDFDNLSFYSFACTINYIIIFSEILIIKPFKIFSDFPKEIKINAFIMNIIYFILALFITGTNMQYYFNTYGNTMNMGIVILDILIVCYLIYSVIVTNKNAFKYKNLMDEVNVKNEELSALNEELIAMNEQLKDYSDTIEELAVTKERNRAARDVHDTLGHSITLLISLLEVSKVLCTGDPERAKEKINEAANVAREGMKELRRSISGLAPEKLAINNLNNALKKLFSEFELSGIKIIFSVDGTSINMNTTYSDVIYRLCQEALTNSLRHGKAKNVNIILQFFEEKIKLFIIDDGKGCKNLNKGFGLSGMEHRIRELKGDIVFGSDGESGFNIRIEIPLV